MVDLGHPDPQQTISPPDPDDPDTAELAEAREKQPPPPANPSSSAPSEAAGSTEDRPSLIAEDLRRCTPQSRGHAPKRIYHYKEQHRKSN
jgi:hypothetical protein